MELSRRSNGFRKVAKWIVGAAVVAGAARGGVDGGSLSLNKNSVTGNKDASTSDSNHVEFISSLGKEYTNKDIDNLVDRTGLNGTGGVTRHMLGVRRAQLLREMERFNSILESLPKDIAEEAGKFATYDKLPAALAKKVKWNFLNKRTFGLMEEVPQDLADEMLKCDIYEGFPFKLADKINAYLDPFDPSTVMKDEEKDGKRVVPHTNPNSKSTEVTEPNSKSTEVIEPNSKSTEVIEPNSKSTEVTEPNSKSTEVTEPNSKTTKVTEDTEKTKDAINEKDDSVNEGKEKSKKGKSWLAKLRS